MLTMHGAKELGISIKEYFSKSENVIEGQLRLQKKFLNDCFCPFFYASLEIEAFGGGVIYSEDGPVNAGQPIIDKIEKITQMQPPKISEAKILHKALDAIGRLKEKAQDEIPIIGVAMSPFSLPVMQMGFEKYLEIMLFRKDLFDHLMNINEEFCVNWANAQLEAGATAICYFDPVSSSTIISRDQYENIGLKIAKRTLARIKGATATHFASGRCLPIADLLPGSGTAAIGVSADENIMELKQAFANKLALIGNLNGVEMRRWSPEEATAITRETIRKAAPGGGFILSDNHGEIPFQVPDDVLIAISETVRSHGRYPIVD